LVPNWKENYLKRKISGFIWGANGEVDILSLPCMSTMTKFMKGNALVVVYVSLTVTKIKCFVTGLRWVKLSSV
jgi:hypothetical protein